MATEFEPMPEYTGTPPDRGQDRPDFNENMNYAFEYFSGLPDAVNAAGESIESMAGESEEARDEAVNASIVAQGAANYVGEWSDLTGPLAAGSGVSHTVSGRRLGFVSAVDMPDVTANEPALGNTDWYVVGGVFGAVPYKTVTASRNLAATDTNQELQVNSASTVELALPLEATGGFVEGDKISFVRLGAGLVAVQAVAGVTINGEDGGRVELEEQYATTLLTRTGTNAWVTPLPGGENTFRTKPAQVFTSADQVSNSISVELDASEFNAWQLDFNGSPLPNTSGNYNITLINLPDAPDQLQVYQLRVKRAGRKTVVLAAENVSEAAVTVNTITTLTYGSASGDWDLITFHRWPSDPSIIYASLGDGRR